MSRITTHVLDTSRGRPAEGVKVTLCRMKVDGWEVVASGVTNADGRVGDWAAAVAGEGTVSGKGDAGEGTPDKDAAREGIYVIRFETKDYFDKLSIASFYPFVEVHFEVIADGHYHIPLLLSPFGYSTYRGS